jgi:phosphatidylglycerophosphate synthase
MSIALWLLGIQGLIGAFDTLYYHEWRARLPAQGKQAALELKLHAARDFFYAVLFGSLALIAWHGRWVIALATVLIAEILLTMTDFVVEARVRKPLGDVYPGERVTHAIMGILYGAMLAFLIPVLARWWSMPTALVPVSADVLPIVQWSLGVMAVGVLLSGARDLYSAYGLPGGNWPWKDERGVP